MKISNRISRMSKRRQKIAVRQAARALIKDEIKAALKQFSGKRITEALVPEVAAALHSRLSELLAPGNTEITVSRERELLHMELTGFAAELARQCLGRVVGNVRGATNPLR